MWLQWHYDRHLWRYFFCLVTDGLVAELRSKLAEAEEEASRVRVNTVRLAEADRCGKHVEFTWHA